MRVQVVHDKDDLLCRWVHHVHQILYLLGPVYGSPAFTDAHMVTASQWLDHGKDAACPIPSVFGIHFFLVARTHGPRFPHILKELVGLLVQADNRTQGIIGTLVDIKDILHGGNECCIRYRRETPILAPMRLRFVFFSVLQTVPRLIESSPKRTFSSSVSMEIVQWE